MNGFIQERRRGWAGRLSPPAAPLALPAGGEEEKSRRPPGEKEGARKPSGRTAGVPNMSLMLNNSYQGGKAFGLLRAKQEGRLEEINKRSSGSLHAEMV
ncbi:UNVERIFIED_CONTAM: hypothetical protein K2H54_047418 [Gekko kuhli]